MSLLFFKAFLFQLIYTTSISVATLLPPRVSTPQKTIYAKEGDTKIVLECQLDVGDHPVAYKWFKQYKWVTADFGHAYRTHKNVYLSLHALTPRHAGTYECEARNDAGVDAASIEVIVEPADEYYTVSGGENAEIPDTASVLSEFAASLNDVLAEGNCSCDVLFLLHASPDAPNETLAAQANFVHTLAHPIISRSLRVGVLTYSDYTVTKLPLGGANDACALKEAFKELNHEKWSTRIRPVLRDAEKKFKKSTSNCKVLFLPIFGSAGNELPNVIASKDLKKLGVEVFVLEVTDTPLPGVDQLASKRGDGRRHHWWIPLKVWTTLVSYMSYMPEELVGCAVNHEDIDGQCVGEGSNCTSSRQCRDPGFGCVDGACQTLQCNVRPDSSDCCGTEGEFWCGDVTGSCEPRDHLCDGKLQCMNGRDEDDCWRTPCHEGDTRCQSSTLCLSPHDLCDGYPHCPAAEDEDPNFCRSFPCPVDKPFRCRDGKCISTELVCDGSFRDCSDGADEDLEYCSGQHVCPTSLPFKCDYGVCVPEKVVCDGAFNCLDALDERLCEERSCPPQRPFKCRHGQCVDVALVCNGVVDACSDGSDEENCTNFSCPNDRSFKCSNGRCIDKWLECDGRNDCGDGSDEDRCGREGSSSSSSSTISTTPSTMTLPPAPTKASCLPDEFFCSSGICLPESKLCDGRNNCINGEDESPEICVHRPCGSPGRVQCANGQCSEGRVCDGVVDCPDESDERDCAYLPEYERPVTDEGSNNNSTFSEGSEISHGTRDGGDDEAAEKQGDLETNLEDVSLSTGEETLSPSISGATNLLTSFRCFVLCFFTFAASRVCSRTLLNAQFPY